MINVLSLQTLDSVIDTAGCTQSNVSCQSNASCLSHRSKAKY